MMAVALKVDVDTYRGTLEGVPALLRLFDEYQVRATFLFSLGPDHTGRALRRIFRPGFLQKVRRTSVASNYGFKTLMYGVLLPGPHIGRKAGDVMRSVAEAGHEVGIHCYDHVRWQDYVAHKDEQWTSRELDLAAETFQEVFGHAATTHGAAGWQLNAHTLKWEEEAGLKYASDVRGKSAFYPVLQGVESKCPQIPTTLPTLDELIGRDGITEENVHEYIYAESQHILPNGHVYTLHAELEGMQLLSTMEKLLVMWKGFEGTVQAVGDTYDSLDLATLPKHQIGWGELEGRSGHLAMQSIAVD
ncbi:MAG: 4-deoxy-4-formamido-L-arabinose-phosphoundecaprenol deformylase [Gammaproteobacteria bacterium (ex Lamellibrachia satsuma)]|nr:MAG: 4-deoxy-4-formamido-L-arabinose-phosphoundecaprenol deformylase [Gammaproteobacteria bacterium (ex Lamellibrachia satsuma)]